MTAFNARRHEAIAYDIITPDATGRNRLRTRQKTEDTVLDAEFVTIREASAVRAGNDNRQAVYQAANVSQFLRARLESAEKRLSNLSADSFSALVAALFVSVFVLCGGLSGLFNTQVAAIPVRPLVITHATLTPQEANGMRLLAVNGIIENNGDTVLTIPPVRANLLSGDNLVASVVIDPPVTSIEPGHSYGFATRIAHPGGKTPELKLSFAGEDVP